MTSEIERSVWAWSDATADHRVARKKGKGQSGACQHLGAPKPRKTLPKPRSRCHSPTSNESVPAEISVMRPCMRGRERTSIDEDGRAVYSENVAAAAGSQKPCPSAPVLWIEVGGSYALVFSRRGVNRGINIPPHPSQSCGINVAATPPL